MGLAEKRIDVTEDIVPIGHFKTHASEHIRNIHRTGRPMIITQNGRAAAVVLTPEEFEELGHRAFVRAKVQAGIESAENEPTLTAAQVEANVIAKVRRFAAKRTPSPSQADLALSSGCEHHRTP
jgi:prevent-host-death family protein